MAVKAKWDKQEGNNGLLTIDVTAEKFDQALDEAFKEVVKTVSLPGFRKGRVPRNIFEQRFGVESLYQDAIDIVLPNAYAEAVEQTGIFPVDQPKVDIETIEKGKGVTFTAEVTVKPEVILGNYKGIEVEEEKVEVTDEEVDEAINELREEQVELVVKEEGKVVEGDTVVIDFEGFLDGEAFEGGKEESYPLEIGSGQFIPGFEDQLVGRETGEEAEINLTFPEDYQINKLAGQDTVFKVKIHEIKEKEYPELDDEFAKDVDDDVETFEELKELKRKDLENAKKHEAENKKREFIIEQVTKDTKIDIPEVMINSEIDKMKRELEQRLQMQGMSLEDYAEYSGRTEEELEEQMREEASQVVKTSLTLEAINKAEKLEVTDEDVSKELDNLTEMYGVDKEQIIEMIGGNESVLKDDLVIKKAIDFIVEQSIVK